MWTWTCSACGQTFTSPVAKRAEADFTTHAREAVAGTAFQPGHMYVRNRALAAIDALEADHD